MILTELTAVPDAALPLAAFREHLRLGQGFADDGAEDGLLLGCLRAAMAAIEARISKVLLAREFLWVLHDWREPEAQPLPVAPVSAVAELRLRDREGVGAVVDPARYALREDALRPVIRATGTALPMVPRDGRAEVEFTAGYAADWDGLPHDLRQAVLLLAAEYYENRREAGTGTMPFGVMALIEHYRTVRVLGSAR